MLIGTGSGHRRVPVAVGLLLGLLLGLLGCAAAGAVGPSGGAAGTRGATGGSQGVVQASASAWWSGHGQPGAEAGGTSYASLRTPAATAPPPAARDPRADGPVPGCRGGASDDGARPSVPPRGGACELLAALHHAPAPPGGTALRDALSPLPSPLRAPPPTEAPSPVGLSVLRV
ncbi:hypothetical protein NPS70_22920 [Streptomyces sp. C10-9-1]|uniref:hypothetical protein n=1 Tax=Streptomyces sp. C10-9-1 TaxID=1859285 RepID=UPI0021115E1D|nr:hypothetical protein [Streptomyces sp. C10-9-1]MCQ6556015.1 hypothetical protein [Streptomyces sp. C10-9-1]